MFCKYGCSQKLFKFLRHEVLLILEHLEVSLDASDLAERLSHLPLFFVVGALILHPDVAKWQVSQHLHSVAFYVAEIAI